MCVPGFGAGFEIALERSKLRKEPENPGEARFHFLCQILVCTKLWFKRDLMLVFIAQLSRDTLQNGVSHRRACLKLSTKGGIAPFWGSANLP